jgi:hypothetical protein
MVSTHWSQLEELRAQITAQGEYEAMGRKEEAPRIDEEGQRYDGEEGRRKVQGGRKKK